MKRKFLRPLLALAMAACLTVPAFAESYTGDAGWRVRFDGNKMDSNFSSSDMDDLILAIQPGDDVTIEVALENAGGYATNWYMTNEVISSLEDSQSVAEGGAYTYTLTYTGPGGAVTTLYDSDAVGGEKESQAGQGLHEATDSLKDYFFLDTLANGQKAKVTLLVALEGETQGNAYQNTLAALQMNFATERAAETPSPSSRVITSVKTGDESHMGLWVVLLICSAAAVVALLVFGKKSRGKDGGVHE